MNENDFRKEYERMQHQVRASSDLKERTLAAAERAADRFASSAQPARVGQAPASARRIAQRRRRSCASLGSARRSLPRRRGHRRRRRAHGHGRDGRGRPYGHLPERRPTGKRLRRARLRLRRQRAARARRGGHRCVRPRLGLPLLRRRRLQSERLLHWLPLPR